MNTETWTRAALGDVTKNWIVGSTPPRTDPACYTHQGGTPWAKAEDVKGGVLTSTAEQLSEAGGRRMQLIQKDYVLLTTAGTIGRAALAGRPMYCNQAVQALEFQPDKVLPRYGLYFLQYRKPVLLREASLAKIPYISKRKLRSMEIRYPSIDIQRSIVGYMQLAEALCEKAARLQMLAGKYLRMLTLREMEQCRDFVPLMELLEGPPKSGLRFKASDNGMAMVTSLDGTRGRLTSLAGCSRVQISPARAANFSLQPGDILLRDRAKEAAGRGAVVGRLPENALVGGNLVRLRLRKNTLSPAWLLAWLLGPGGDRVYPDGTLQKRSLGECEVPAIQNSLGFQRIFDLYAELAEKTVLFSEGTQNLYQGLLRRMFEEGAEGEVFDKDWFDSGLDGSAVNLTQPMRRFLEQMSQFQQRLYQMLVLSKEEQPVHVLYNQMGRRRDRSDGLQEALSAMELLEQFGFAERENMWKIPAPLPDGAAGPGREEQYIVDHNGQPIYIDKYKLAETISEEDEYAAGAGEDPKL